MTLSLFPTTAADYDELATWITDARLCRWWAGPRVPFPFTRAELPARLEAGGWVGRSLRDANGALLAFGQYRAGPPGTAYLGMIIVNPRCRGQGLVGALLGALMPEALAQTGAARAALKVFRENAVALRAYQRFGFIEDSAQSTGALSHLERRP